MLVHCEATFRPTDADALVGVAKAWFNTSRDELFPDLWQQVDTSDPRFAVTVTTRATWEARPDVTAYRPAKWPGVLDGLTTRPAAMTVLVRAAGTTSDPDILRINLEPAIGSGKVIRLQLDANQAEDQTADPVHCRRWVDFLATALAEADPDFALITDDAPASATELEISLNRSPQKGIQESRTLLRGYSWVTVCPEELAARLGGVPTLADSGAFVRVDSLPGGGTLLQATKTLAQYREPAPSHVRQTLTPVLPRQTGTSA